MKNSMNSSAQQPMIVKYLESLHNGIQSQILSRYAIGYILRILFQIVCLGNK